MLRILYVEDNAANLSLVHRVARVGGHEVVNRTSGESALADFSNIRPDIVLMDIQLEGKLTGLDVVRQLRAEGYTETPIIAVTAYAMKGDKEKALDAGCNDYLPKPLPIKELVALIDKYQKVLEQRKTGEVKAVTPLASAKTSAPKTASNPETTSNQQPTHTPPSTEQTEPNQAKTDEANELSKTEVADEKPTAVPPTQEASPAPEQEKAQAKPDDETAPLNPNGYRPPSKSLPNSSPTALKSEDQTNATT